MRRQAELIFSALSVSKFSQICRPVHQYLTHGYSICVPWALPPGVLLDDGEAGPNCIWVSEGKVKWHKPPAPDDEAFEVNEDRHNLYWPILGSASVALDGQVRFEPVLAAPQGILPHAVLGPVSAHWIYLQGKIALHANCVAIDGQLAAIVGSSGAGKSSLAAALLAEGADPHGDDVISVEPSSARVPFGASRIKLNPDVLSVLSLRPLSVGDLYAGIDKRSVEFACPADRSTRPLRVVYRLRDAEHGTAPHFNEVTGFPLALALLSEVYRPHIATQAFGLQEMLHRCATLVGKVRMYDLVRPRDLSSISDLAQVVIAHFQTHGLR